MSEFKCDSKVGDYQVGYFYEIVNGKEVILDYAVLDESGKVIMSGFNILKDALSWAEETSCRDLADLIESELQKDDSEPELEPNKTTNLYKPR
ncbi:hypothetical protein EGC79_11140 [Shewanella vesiculosa]|uniref:hypothetical protein n=1 Tax=Shewanella vesiculosa TaxID=518738 RepID=UPI000F4F143A|nr:hypothetical protein [Shewanella vesiculosa]RPA50638.1 hypothetical protein EGC79_11140 [Shewanella vesiculosa]UJL44363.1 hypothetical protein KDH10_001857 [Shewanella vesiculosa]